MGHGILAPIAPTMAADRPMTSILFISHLAAVLLAALALLTIRFEFGGKAATRLEWAAPAGHRRRNAQEGEPGPRPPADPRAAGLGRRRRGGTAAAAGAVAVRDLQPDGTPVERLRRAGRRGDVPGGVPRRPLHRRALLQSAAIDPSRHDARSGSAQDAGALSPPIRA